MIIKKLCVYYNPTKLNKMPEDKLVFRNPLSKQECSEECAMLL